MRYIISVSIILIVIFLNVARGADNINGINNATFKLRLDNASQNFGLPSKDYKDKMNHTDYSEELQNFLRVETKNRAGNSYEFFVEKIDDHYIVTIKGKKRTEFKKIPETYVNDLFQVNNKDREGIENRVLKIIFKPGPK